MKITDKQRSVIGSSFKTDYGSVLTVTDIVGTQKGRVIFKLVCSICSKDKELWPEGSIISGKIKLNKGNYKLEQVPCGCAKSPRWSVEQMYTLVARDCETKGYLFHGWSGDFKGIRTKLDIEDPVTGVRWGSTSIDTLLYNKKLRSRRFSIDKTEVKRKTDEEHVKDFMNMGGFSEDYKFWRIDRRSKDGRKPFWEYQCPTCITDEYSRAGVCSGVFQAHGKDLKKGKKSCRCNSKYHWTQEQREYQIMNYLKESGGIFIGWECGMYKNSNSKFMWICTEGHICKTSVANLLSYKVGCRVCHKIHSKDKGSGFGYYPHRKDEEDFLYIIHFKNDQVIKVGRSFNVYSRIASSGGLLNNSGHSWGDIKILHIGKARHQQIFDLEQAIHKELKQKGIHKPLSWTRETFLEDCEDFILETAKRLSPDLYTPCDQVKAELNKNINTIG